MGSHGIEFLEEPNQKNKAAIIQVINNGPYCYIL